MTPQLEMAKEFFGSLPKAPKGKKLIGIEYRQPEAEDVFLMAMGEWQLAWHKYGTEKPVGIFEDIPAEEVKTDLADLVGEDGQKNLYIHLIHNDGKRRTSQERVSVTGSGNLMIGGNCIDNCKKQGYRWSHSPFTPYKQANKFV